MGVKGLWKIIEEAGRPIHNPESLIGQKIAVDASIWLYQFLRALPPGATGEAYSPLVLAGLFQRICKLLYFGIRPIIVFDGAAPAVKLKTIKERTLRRGQAEERHRRMARKIIAAQLHLEELRLKQEAEGHSEKKEEKLHPVSSPAIDDFDSLGFDSVFDEESHGADDIKRPEFILDPQYVASIDVFSADFNKLPLAAQQEILLAKRDAVLREHVHSLRQREIRDGPLPALDFSNFQVEALVKRRKITEKLHEVNEGATFDFEGDYALSARFREQMEDARRIASDANRRYLLVKKSSGGYFLDSTVQDPPTMAEKDNKGYNAEAENVITKDGVDSIFGSPSECTATDNPMETYVLAKATSSLRGEPSIQVNDGLSLDVEEYTRYVEDNRLQPIADSFDISPSGENKRKAAPLSVVDLDLGPESSFSCDPQTTDASSVEPLAVQTLNSVIPTATFVGASESSKIAETTVIAHEPPKDVLESGDDRSEAGNFVEEMEGIYQEMGSLKEVSNQEKIEQLRREIALLRDEQRSSSNLSHSTSIDIELLEDFQQLLTIMGVPWMFAPAEAEAQCAYFQSTNIADGIITDDSDVFLFNGDRVYRHFFTASKRITLFLRRDIEREIKFDVEKLRVLAILLGCDYSAGISGIGPIKAQQLVNTIAKTGASSSEQFLSITEDGLKYGKWPILPDGSDFSGEDKKFLNRLSIQCAIGEKRALYDPAALEAYRKPLIEEVGNSREFKFSWKVLQDLTSLNSFLVAKLNWSPETIKKIVDPIISKQISMNSRLNSGQLLMDSFIYKK